MTSDPPHAPDLGPWRREYADRGLTEADLDPDPTRAFQTWMDEAGRTGLYEPNAMVVSTVGDDGDVSSRMVLLKAVDGRGFVFYTNFESAKAADLRVHPQCALLFPWHPLERQIRVEGIAEQVGDEEADAYFATRPRAAQLGAWASPQSHPVASRDYLSERYAFESDRLAATDPVPRPPHWGGYLIRPHRIEFWQGRPGRMHDRIRFDRIDEDSWAAERLAP
jgi:pyridoxamine 5'-phosphate oxidase